MNEVQHAIETFCKYSPQEKIDFLIQVAHALTILARDSYAVGEDGLTNPPRLRIINEIQHRLTGFLVALRKQDLKRYPEDVLVRMILEHPEDLDLQRQLQETCSRVMGQIATTT
ncbi:MAG: hypothetical protein HYZ81_11325 [Nitrospinae bacterium]|nr:hypothetical protein [Nitrospinota bacterium]